MRPWICLMMVAVTGFVQNAAFAQEALKSLDECEYVPASWADGDSFQIRTKSKEVMTIRLYGVDCVEWHVNDRTDAKRLSEQRRYFGISSLGGSPQSSIETAKGFGKTASKRVEELLRTPFTVYTSFADARGDGKHPRVYAFVKLSDGRDLARVLVEEGLARAFGVHRETPNGDSRAEYRELLRDLELQAAKMGRGIWKHTDWNALPTERREQRQEDADLDLATSQSSVAPGVRVDPNTAARDELLKLPGVGEVMANRIIESRPYGKLDDLLNVPGIGAARLEKLKPYFEIRGQPR